MGALVLAFALSLTSQTTVSFGNGLLSNGPPPKWGVNAGSVTGISELVPFTITTDQLTAGQIVSWDCYLFYDAGCSSGEAYDWSGGGSDFAEVNGVATWTGTIPQVNNNGGILYHMRVRLSYYSSMGLQTLTYNTGDLIFGIGTP